MIRILCVPPYYERHSQSAIYRLRCTTKYLNYEIYTIDRNISINNSNFVLSMCRTVINEEQIHMLIADSSIGQLLIAKLCQEYPKIYNKGMNFRDTLHCINRYLIIDLFGTDECIPTISIEITDEWESSFQLVKDFLSDNKIDGYIKPLYNYGHKLSTLRFSNWKDHTELLHSYIERYKEQFTLYFLPLFRVYVSLKQYPSIFKPSYLIQPYYDLVTYPHWRLVIANACIYDKEIIMWPLVDGYSAWPFLAEKPLAILPILICPTRQISIEQQKLIYNRFRQHLNHLIKNSNLRYGWIQCSYFISCINEIRLVSIKPSCSVYLTEAFTITNQYGNPIIALSEISNHQRPQTPIVNGKTVYIHRLWGNFQEKYSIDDLIYMKEVKRIHRLDISMNCYVHLRYQESDIINNDNEKTFIDVGFMGVNGKYYEMGLTNLIEFRYRLLKKPELFPFVHQSMLANNPNQFDPITCLPSNDLLEQLEKFRKQEQKDLI